MAKKARKRRSYGRKKRKLNANAGALIVIIAVLCFTVVMGFRIRTMKETDHRYEVQAAALEAELEAEEQRREELEESKEYVQSQDYIERLAREKLGLIDPDEMLVKPNG